jgi:hypothetical protein
MLSLRFEIQKNVIPREIFNPESLPIAAIGGRNDLVFYGMLVQLMLCLLVLLEREICSKAGHWDTVDEVGGRHVVGRGKVRYQLTAEEVVIDPPKWVDPSLLALQDLAVELLRLGEVVSGDGVVEGLAVGLRLH